MLDPFYEISIFSRAPIDPEEKHWDVRREYECCHFMMKNDNKCPKCGSKNVADIMYGLPAESPELFKALKEGKISLGGCCITDDDPKWHCNECEHEWGQVEFDF